MLAKPLRQFDIDGITSIDAPLMTEVGVARIYEQAWLEYMSRLVQGLFAVLCGLAGMEEFVM